MEEETRCSTCGTMHNIYMSCGVCKEHAWEAEQRRLRANTIVLKREVLQWKTEKGDSWFAKNYLRLLYAFQDDTNDWHEYLEYGLANTLNGEEKRLVDALNKIGHLDKDSFNKLSTEKFKTSKIASIKESQDNISKLRINATLSYLIPFVLCLIFWFTSEWFFVFKILAVVVIFSFCVVIMFPILDLVNGVDKNNAGEKFIEPFKKMETERLSLFAFLNDLKQQGKDLTNASLNRKEYLYDAIFVRWNKKEFLLGNNIQNEVDEINKLVRKIEQNIDMIFSGSPLCTTSIRQVLR